MPVFVLIFKAPENQLLLNVRTKSYPRLKSNFFLQVALEDHATKKNTRGEEK